MLPTIDQYIASSIRALSEVVMPAVDRSDMMAVEQLQIVIGLLTLLGDQWDKALLLQSAELRGHLRLARALTDVADGAGSTHESLATARQAINDADRLARVDIPTHAALKAASHALLDSIVEMVVASRSDGTAGFRAQTERLVLEYAAEQNRLARSWFAGSRLDADWAKLPSIAELLASYSDAG